MIRSGSTQRRARRGLTLPELTMSIAVMGMVGLGMAALASAVRASKLFADGQMTVAQNARVTLERIQNNVMQATTSADFPGIAVFTGQVGGYTFPDTLVVWRPTGAPANASGPPLYKELAIYCPDPAFPNRLVEITVPTDNRTTPPLTDTATWQTNLQTIKSSSSATKVLLTDLVRVADSGSTNGSQALRGAVRFRAVIRPSAADWTNYKNGTVAWTDLPWVQDIRGSQYGLRQAWCSIELQLTTTASPTPLTGSAAGVTAFFGSAALYYNLQK